MSRLVQKLSEMLPKREHEPTPDGRQLIPFRTSPIRQHADQFAAWMPELPKDHDELRAVLWVFGEQIAGDMERRMNAVIKLASDAIYTQTPIIIYPNDILLNRKSPPPAKVKG